MPPRALVLGVWAANHGVGDEGGWARGCRPADPAAAVGDGAEPAALEGARGSHPWAVHWVAAPSRDPPHSPVLMGPGVPDLAPKQPPSCAHPPAPLVVAAQLGKKVAVVDYVEPSPRGRQPPMEPRVLGRGCGAHTEGRTIQPRCPMSWDVSGFSCPLQIRGQGSLGLHSEEQNRRASGPP